MIIMIVMTIMMMMIMVITKPPGRRGVRGLLPCGPRLRRVGWGPRPSEGL